MGHDVRIKVVFDYECPLLEPRILTNPHMIQTGHIWFFQLAVCFWVLGLPLFQVWAPHAKPHPGGQRKSDKNGDMILISHMGVNPKNRGKNPKMDGENNGTPY